MKIKIYYKGYKPRPWWIVSCPILLQRSKRFRNFSEAKTFANDLLETLKFKISFC